ncbi:MAG: YqgE/AlgH family protein [Planctomycetota bacterium]
MKSHAGRLLIASPFLRDENFFRTVILMVRHDEEGAFGLVLNRQTTHRVSHVLQDVLQLDALIPRRDHLFLGGPVTGPMIVLHDVPGIGDPIPDDDGDAPVWMTADENEICTLARETQQRCRFFVGYSGWGEGQLEREIASGDWMLADSDNWAVFDSPEDIWKTTLDVAGREVLGVAVPDARHADPLLN